VNVETGWNPEKTSPADRQAIIVPYANALFLNKNIEEALYEGATADNLFHIFK